jgi:hypothetical protein
MIENCSILLVIHMNRSRDFWRSLTLRIDSENTTGEIDRAYGRSGRLGYGSSNERGMIENCSSLLVSHINRSCEIGTGEVGVDNVHHAPVKDKHDAVNINV